jgi:DNA-binding XRE family transcriptional regulator
MTVQFIELEGKPTFAVVPIGEWNAMQARMEELQDIADAKAARETEYLPAEFVNRLLDEGDHPLRVWRNFRGYSLEELARRCGVSRQMLSMIENGKANPSAELLAKLAGALDCDMDDLHR